MKLKTNKINKSVENQYDRYINVKGVELMVKRFLTIEEIGEVVANCLSQTDPLKRRIMYYSTLVDVATNIDISQFVGEDELISGDKIYNALAENELLDFDNVITNAHHIYLTIKETESVSNVVKGAIEELGTNMNSADIVKSLTDATNELKNQEAIHNELMK